MSVAGKKRIDWFSLTWALSCALILYTHSHVFILERHLHFSFTSVFSFEQETLSLKPSMHRRALSSLRHTSMRSMRVYSISFERNNWSFNEKLAPFSTNEHLYLDLCLSVIIKRERDGWIHHHVFSQTLDACKKRECSKVMRENWRTVLIDIVSLQQYFYTHIYIYTSVEMVWKIRTPDVRTSWVYEHLLLKQQPIDLCLIQKRTSDIFEKAYIISGNHLSEVWK